MPNIYRYRNTIQEEVVSAADSLLGTCYATRKTKKFIIDDLMSMFKKEMVNNSAYGIALNEGFVGSEIEWIESLHNINLVVKNEIPLGSINGQNAIFRSIQKFIPETLEVFSNGLKQTIISDYTTSGNKMILLKFSPNRNENLTINYLKQV